MTTAVAVLLLVTGILGVLRSVVIVVGNGTGRFRYDPAVSVVVGFGLCFLGQALLV